VPGQLGVGSEQAELLLPGPGPSGGVGGRRGPGFYVIDIDATLIDAHSEKERAAPTYKRGFGFHPLLAYLDATGEALAGLLRPGYAGSGTAEDHITVLDDALAQLPVDPHRVGVITPADSAGLSHGFLDACRERHVRFVVGHRLTTDIASGWCRCPSVPAVRARVKHLPEHLIGVDSSRFDDPSLGIWQDFVP
jgi:Transposase DDE domain group 1